MATREENLQKALQFAKFPWEKALVTGKIGLITAEIRWRNSKLYEKARSPRSFLDVLEIANIPVAVYRTGSWDNDPTVEILGDDVWVWIRDEISALKSLLEDESKYPIADWIYRARRVADTMAALQMDIPDWLVILANGNPRKVGAVVDEARNWMED